MGDGQQNGWNEYSKLVLKELETLANGIVALQKDFTHIREEIAAIKQNEDRVMELREWKEKIDEIASPSQLQTKFDEVEELKMFKTKAVTIFAVVQFGMAFFAWAMKFI